MLKQGLIFVLVFFIVVTAIEILVFDAVMNAQLVIREIATAIIAYLITRFIQSIGKKLN